MKKILLVLVFCVLCNNAWAGDKELINNLGNQLDKCRDEFMKTDDTCEEKGTTKCYYYNMERYSKLQKCYNTVADEIFDKFYDGDKERLKEEFANMLKATDTFYLSAYYDNKFCDKKNCGLLPTLLAKQATTMYMQDYLIVILDYLLKRKDY